MILIGHPQPLATVSDDDVLLEVFGVLVAERHLDTGEDQEATEDVEDPRELMDQEGSNADHEAAHEQRTDDAPEQYLVMVLRRDFEVSQDEDDDEDVVDR